MNEQQLADLLVQMGLDRGFSIEQVMDELAAIRLPSYVDQGRFRAVLVGAAEAQLRAQFEERLNRLRQQYSMAESASPISGPMPTVMPVGQGRVRLDPGLEEAPSAPKPAAGTGSNIPFQAGPMKGPQPSEAKPDEQDMPRDATIFWGNRDGGEPR